MTSHFSVSVVIPLYNHERYIEAALESVWSQVMRPREVIVVDDGSTDGSFEAVSRMSRSFPELVCWSQPNQGAHYAINAGIHRATGDLVAVLNSDDLYHPRRLARCMDVLVSRPDAAAVCTGLGFVDDGGREINNPWYRESRAFYDKVGDLPLALMNGNFFMTTSNLVIRRRVFEEVGYFAPLRYAHDLDFFLRLLARDLEIHFLDEPLLFYRMHGRNTILEEHARVRVEWAFGCARFLHSLNRFPGRCRRGWDYVDRITRIVERHSLQRLVMLFLAYFAGGPAAEEDAARFLQDPEFYRIVHKVAAE